MPLSPMPIRTILVPLDGSPVAERALPIAVAIARRSGAKLRLALVHRSPSPPVSAETVRLYTSIEVAVRRSERTYLRGVASRLQAGLGRPVRSALLTDGVGPALAHHAHHLGVDLVVLSTHGRGAFRRAWLGSVADYLVRTLEIPVLLVRATDATRPPSVAEPEICRILVALDGSPLAESVLAPAGALARLFEAELSLVQVIQPLVLASDPPLPFPTGYDTELTDIRRSGAQDYLDSLVEQLRAGGLQAAGAAVLGANVSETLLDLSRPDGIGLVALATHGYAGLRRLVLGSVADKIVRASEVPVLVVRPTPRPPRRAPRGARPRGRRRPARPPRR